MESHDRNQQRAYHDDLHGHEAVAKIREIVNKTKACFFSTAVTTAGSSGARPMMVRELDAHGNFWFLSAIDTHKDQELQLNPQVTLYFQHADHADFLEINGRATVSQDKQRIKALWEPALKAWFKDADDPRISVIKVEPQDGHYWDSQSGPTATGIKMFIANFFQQPLRGHSTEGDLRI